MNPRMPNEKNMRGTVGKDRRAIIASASSNRKKGLGNEEHENMEA